MSKKVVRIIIDREKCIGSGNCVFNAEGVFEQDEEGIAVVLDPDALNTDTVEFAALSCPVNAIVVETE